MNESQDTYELALKVGLKLQAKKMFCAMAESCTGGGLAAALTDVAGSSKWFDRGFVTYSNQAKQDLLDVPESVIISNGAVSEAVVCAMALGAIAHSDAQASIAVSGIAGPDGGSLEKPVGTVWIAWAVNSHVTSQCYFFNGDRHAIRQQAINTALSVFLGLII